MAIYGYLWLACGMSNVCLWHIFGTSRILQWSTNCTHMANLGNICGIPTAHVVCLRNHIWHIPEMYVWHVPAIYVAKAYLCGTSVACLLHTYCVCGHMQEQSFGLCMLHLWNVSGMSMVHLCYIYKYCSRQGGILAFLSFG